MAGRPADTRAIFGCVCARPGALDECTGRDLGAVVSGLNSTGATTVKASSKTPGIRDDLHALSASQQSENLSNHDCCGPRDNKSVIARKLRVSTTRPDHTTSPRRHRHPPMP